MPLVGTSSVPTVDLIEVSGKQGMDVWYGDVGIAEDATKKERYLSLMMCPTAFKLQSWLS